MKGSFFIVLIETFLEDVHEQLLHVLYVFSHGLRLPHELFENTMPFLVCLLGLPALLLVFLLQMVQLCFVLLGLLFSQKTVYLESVDFAVDLVEHALQLFLLHQPILLFLSQYSYLTKQIFSMVLFLHTFTSVFRFLLGCYYFRAL